MKLNNYISVWHVLGEQLTALRNAANEDAVFSDLQTKQLYQRVQPGDYSNPSYAETGYRFLIYPMPERFDRYGADKMGGDWGGEEQVWVYVIDDFGNAVPAEFFNHYSDGYGIIWCPAEVVDPVTNMVDYAPMYETMH